LELLIIEQRLMDPKLSTSKIIKKLDLKCSQANIQKIYKRWGLAKFKKPVLLRGVISQKPPENSERKSDSSSCHGEKREKRGQVSAKSRFPNLIENANLKINPPFLDLLQSLSYRSVSVSNPGAIIVAPFLDQPGVVEALATYGPLDYSQRCNQMTNDIIMNILRIIAGFPTINDFTLNSDRSAATVAIGAGLSLSPKKSRYYDSFDQIRFHHLQKLRNDASCRAREIGITQGKEIAIDYHCSPSHFTQSLSRRQINFKIPG
jgi:hypothetical protein